jgi:hypothetical protein
MSNVAGFGDGVNLAAFISLGLENGAQRVSEIMVVVDNQNIQRFIFHGNSVSLFIL